MVQWVDAPSPNYNRKFHIYIFDKQKLSIGLVTMNDFD